MNRKIYVTETYLPPYDELTGYLATIYENRRLTNKGPLLVQLEQRLREHLSVDHVQCLGNGTLALQLALRAFSLREGEVITTPFSYVATVSSILWEGFTPVFVDIEPDNLTLDPAKIEAAVTPRTRAVMPVHVFGYACDVETIQSVADKYGLTVIYDGAHAFASRYKGKSLLAYGDMSTCSFHATKLFHTGEGGACITSDKAAHERLDLLKRFGHNLDEHMTLGINAKLSELHAAMGLANLPHLEAIMADRKRISARYDALLEGVVQRPVPQTDLAYNYSYYPVLFTDEQALLRVFAALREAGIFPRRYFSPSLTTLPYLAASRPCPIADGIAPRIACLPLFAGLQEHEIETICAIIKAFV